MARPDRARLRFATRVLLLQLGTVVLVVALCTGVYLFLAVQQLRASSQAAALGIARTVAEDPTVRELVAEFSADPGTPAAAGLRDGELQRTASGITERTGVLFVVITDDHGIRLAHPQADRLGQEVSTPYDRVLQGHEVVDWERGTLGVSARAKVPVYAPGAEGTGPDAQRPVGEVSVGFEQGSVFDDLPALLGSIALAALGGIGIATLATLLMRRRWERLTLGLQPEELAALVQNQTAVLDGVGDGVLGIDPDGTVLVCNAAAERMLGIDRPVGRPLAELGLPAPILAALAADDEGSTDAPRSGGGTAREADIGVLHAGRVLYVEPRPVRRGQRRLGRVVIVRDRTDLVALSERLETVRAMTGALRVQRHEFANRMHVAAGLIDAERVPEAREFLGELVERGAVGYPVLGLDRLGDPFLHAFLGAKGIEAGERGVRLRIGEDTQLLGAIRDPENTAAVLGNLIDNAVSAAVRGPEPRWVEATLLDDGDALVLTVGDSGAGIPPGTDVFARDGRGGSGASTSVGEPAGGLDESAHGHGLGLPLSREIARASGGDLWIVDQGGAGAGPGADGGPGSRAGAVFAARIGGAVAPDRGAGDAPPAHPVHLPDDPTEKEHP
ncbi:sensor histidine kinase [Leucobacter iarius]|uniref:Sensor-like histidine kinase SenX3 n=1 Tax=Leucobacter iarius TaxID=333963 RepID=A0ABN2L716_9MICO